MLKALREIITKYPFVVYGALMLLITGSAFFIQRVYWVLQPPPLNAHMTLILAFIAFIPLTWRWLYLITAFVFFTATLVTLDVFSTTTWVNFTSVATIVSIFSAAAYGGRRRNFACVASIVVFIGGLMFKLLFGANTVLLSSVTLFNVTGLVWSLVTLLAIWRFGNTARSRRERISHMSESTQQLVRENI